MYPSQIPNKDIKFKQPPIPFNSYSQQQYSSNANTQKSTNYSSNSKPYGSGTKQERARISLDKYLS
jgi:hypothetical protein